MSVSAKHSAIVERDCVFEKVVRDEDIDTQSVLVLNAYRQSIYDLPVERVCHLPRDDNGNGDGTAPFYRVSQAFDELRCRNTPGWCDLA